MEMARAAPATLSGDEDAAPVSMLTPDVLTLIFGWVDTKTLLLAVPSVCRGWAEAMGRM